MISEISAIAASGNASGRLMPVPTAVPPSASSASSSLAAWTRAIPLRTCAAYPPNSCPSRTGVASIRCVRPHLMTSSNSSALASSDAANRSSAGTRSDSMATRAATCMAVGITSFDDWP